MLVSCSRAEAIAEQLCDFNSVILFGLAGATLFVIGSHAAFRELEASDVEELLMEPVWRASFKRLQIADMPMCVFFFCFWCVCPTLDSVPGLPWFASKI